MSYFRLRHRTPVESFKSIHSALSKRRGRGDYSMVRRDRDLNPEFLFRKQACSRVFQACASYILRPTRLGDPGVRWAFPGGLKPLQGDHEVEPFRSRRSSMPRVWFPWIHVCWSINPHALGHGTSKHPLRLMRSRKMQGRIHSVIRAYGVRRSNAGLMLCFGDPFAL